MMNREKGFTLVEILIALTVGMIMLMAIYGIVNMTQKSTAGIERRVISQKDVRGALDLMALELRMASYTPNPGPATSGMWLTAACAAGGVSSYKGIQAATANSITIEMDADDSGTLNDHANEIITYTYNAANQLITRSANCGTAQTFIGASTVRINNNTAGVPVFRYFDYNNIPIAAASLPGAIPDIRAIEITLVAQSEEIDPMTKARRNIVYSTRVIPRNHGLNP